MPALSIFTRMYFFFSQIAESFELFCSKKRYVLLLLSLIYLAGYLAHPAVPGGSFSTFPMSWWGWFDQGNYLASANAIVNLDFRAESHFYPPLYPLLGAVFIKLLPGHPYFFVNLICFLWISYVFLYVSDSYLPRSIGCVIFLLTTIVDSRIFENYLIPWSTTINVALLSAGIYFLAIARSRSLIADGKFKYRTLFLAALMLGLTVCARPVDGVVAALLALCIYLKSCFYDASSERTLARTFAITKVMAVGFCVGPVIFFVFNWFVFGDPLGGYLQKGVSNGYPLQGFFSELAEKSTSIFLDSETLYGEPGAALFEKFPWLLLSVCGLFWVAFKGDFFVKSVAVSILTLFILYLPFGDLLPTGLWRYLNIHYFKWMFPYLGLIIGLFAVYVAKSFKRKNNRILITTAITVTVALGATLQLDLKIERADLIQSEDGRVQIYLSDAATDFIDVGGVSGNFNDTYFGWENNIYLDGRRLNMVRDFRLIPISKDTTRVLFIRPIIGRVIEWDVAPNLNKEVPSLRAFSGRIGYKFGRPLFLRENTVEHLAVKYTINQSIRFSIGQNGSDYAYSGWHSPEPWGTWSAGKEAKIRMFFTEKPTGNIFLRIRMVALVSDTKKCQTVIINANKIDIGNEEICLGKWNSDADSIYPIPVDIFEHTNRLDLTFKVPGATTPSSLKINSDNRVLGVGLISLAIEKRQTSKGPMLHE